MRVLKRGLTGDDVTAWQNFLAGAGYLRGEVTGTFDGDTEEASKAFQADHGLTVDGIVGPKSQAVAAAAGLPVEQVAGEDRAGPNWPAPLLAPMSKAEMDRVFGVFAYKPAGSAANPEAITITDGWAMNNIVPVTIPQLAPLGYPRVPFHKAAAPQLVALWQAWDDAGLLPLVKTWAGSWAPRFVRGSRTTLSNHSRGTAFDINAAWNGLGKVPALVGKTGSVRELVPLAAEHGFFWGGWGWGGPDGTRTASSTRLDGMHFEVSKLTP